jgi:FG-GAP-like repeat
VRYRWLGVLLLGAACSGTATLLDSGPPPPPTQCTIAGVTYASAAPNPSNPCQSCQPLATDIDWSSLPFGLPCGSGGALCVSGACLAGCDIGGVFYPPDALNHLGACQSCQPQTTSTDWSPLTDATGPGCDGGIEICLNGSCQAGCLIAGALVAPGTADPTDACKACDPAADRTGWSPIVDGTACGSNQLCVSGTCQSGCLVGGSFYASGQLDPLNVCQSCQPVASRNGFTALTGLPQGGGCDGGEVCASGHCAGGCFISGAYELPGARSSSDNGVCCSPANTTTGWTSAFVPQSSLATGGGPMGLVIADFNADGHPDFATVDRSDGTVTVFLSAADGGFGDPLVLAVGGAPVAIAAADLDGDRLPDLVVANADDQTVSVLLNAGAILCFSPQVTYGTLGDPSALAVGDLDGDGRPDLAVTNLDQGTVAVLLGVGAGAFGTAVPFSVGDFPQAVVVADLNGDTFLDLAVANSNDDAIAVLLNDGHGSFGTAVAYPVGAHPTALVAGDLDGDGISDLVVANSFDNTLGVLLNDGTGNFPPQTVVAVGVPVYSLAIADFNSDDLQDVAVADYTGGQAGILLNKGGGALASPFFAAVGPAFSAYALAAADLNGDLVKDLAVVGLDNATLQILINSCP